MCMMSLTTAFMQKCVVSSGTFVKHYSTREYTQQYVSPKYISTIPLHFYFLDIIFLLVTPCQYLIYAWSTVCITICTSTALHLYYLMHVFFL